MNDISYDIHGEGLIAGTAQDDRHQPLANRQLIDCGVEREHEVAVDRVSFVGAIQGEQDHAPLPDREVFDEQDRPFGSHWSSQSLRQVGSRFWRKAMSPSRASSVERVFMSISLR